MSNVIPTFCYCFSPTRPTISTCIKAYDPIRELSLALFPHRPEITPVQYTSSSFMTRPVPSNYPDTPHIGPATNFMPPSRTPPHSVPAHAPLPTTMPIARRPRNPFHYATQALFTLLPGFLGPYSDTCPHFTRCLTPRTV